jgi:hypothetical protein
MSLEQRSPEPDAKDKKSSRLQRGPFLATWLAKSGALEPGEDFGEQAEDDVELLDNDWRRFRHTWHIIFSGIKIPGLTLPTKRKQRKGQRMLGAEAIAVVSDKYRGELHVPHVTNDTAEVPPSNELVGQPKPEAVNIESAVPLVDEAPTVLPPQPVFVSKPPVSMTPPVPIKPLERSAPMPQAQDTIPQTVQQSALTTIVENRRPLDFKYLDTVQKHREYLDTALDKSEEPALVPVAPTIHPRSGMTITPLAPSQPALELPSLDDVDLPKETALQIPGEQIIPAELAEEVSHEITPVATSNPTHVADILANSPLFNQPAPVSNENAELVLPVTTPVMEPVMSVDQPAPYVITRPEPMPLTPDFSAPVTATRIPGALYRQAIKTGFWAGITVTLVLVVLYLVK